MTSILISFQFFLWLTPHKCSPLEFGDSPLKFGKPKMIHNKIRVYKECGEL